MGAKSQTKKATQAAAVQEPAEVRDFIEELDIQMRSHFAKEVQAFESGGHCQMRIIGMRSPVDGIRRPGLLFNYCLPATPSPTNCPTRHPQWVFKIDLPDVADAKSLRKSMATLIPRLPQISETLMMLHESLGQITTTTKAEAFAKLIASHGEPLDDPSGMQFMLSPYSSLESWHVPFERRTNPMTDEPIEQWIADWVTDVERTKARCGPTINKQLFASFKVLDPSRNLYQGAGGEHYVIHPMPGNASDTNSFVLESSVICALPHFDSTRRTDVDDSEWFCKLRRVVSKAELGMNVGLFMFDVNGGHNPLGKHGKKVAAEVAATLAVAESLGDMDFT